ncbi:MAG TPA: retroviral-like aspartic protease family protein [Terriglobia bacterium]|nr:retroviral-like aspartic protease family protein [Terriglobia bacterium]
MGITSFKAVVSDNGKSVPVDFLVDSGAHLTLLPLETWQTLGLEPRESMEFTLADGTHISRKVSWSGITLMERTGYTPVILGEPGDEALLGVVTLEEFGLMLNPLNRTLVPMRMLLK